MPRKPASVVPTTGKDPDEKLTLAEVCVELKISRSTFYDWRQKRKAPPCTILPNGGIRVVRRDLEAWLDSCRDVA
jgi:predicted DNA-binding transcriptional regulator AlpA